MAIHPQTGMLSGTLPGTYNLVGTVRKRDYLQANIQIPSVIGTKVDIATTDRAGIIMVGDNLIIDPKNGRLSVDCATDVEADNTRPITSAAVYTEIGNINSLLESI